MNESDKTTPAFPQMGASGNGTMLTGVMFGNGMAMRDWFAGMALAGQCAYEGMEGCDVKLVAGFAYEMADAMMSERAK